MRMSCTGMTGSRRIEVRRLVVIRRDDGNAEGMEATNGGNGRVGLGI